MTRLAEEYLLQEMNKEDDRILSSPEIDSDEDLIDSLMEAGNSINENMDELFPTEDCFVPVVCN